MDTVKLSAPMPDGNKCPQCATPLPTGALAGLCPACLLKMGAAADTVTDGKQSAFQPPTVAELAPLFPQLEILELIGKGGMGAVYKARQKQLDRLVALKILPPGIGNDAAFAERFAREAKALAKLNHPGIVTLYEFGVAESHSPSPLAARLFYFLMEFVDGLNLRQLLHAGRISPREAIAIVPQICDALQFAHDQGIVHRDIKPENILLDRRGRVKVADFGLAKIVEGRDAPLGRPDRSSQRDDPTLTDAGKVMGTPQYMSPEQRENPGEVDHRADIYALGVVFYQMLTGELPGKKLEAPSKKVSIDVRLDEIVLRALEKKPELRYQQASVLKTQVETIASTPGSSSGRESAQSETPPSSGLQWNFWGVIGAALGSSVWMPVTAITSGWSGAGVALSDLTLAGVLMAALAIWSNRHRVSTFQGVMLLLGAVFVASATFLLGAHWLELSVRSSWPGGKMMSSLPLLWILLLFPVLAVWFWFMHKSGRVQTSPIQSAQTEQSEIGSRQSEMPSRFSRKVSGGAAALGTPATESPYLKTKSAECWWDWRRWPFMSQQAEQLCANLTERELDELKQRGNRLNMVATIPLTMVILMVQTNQPMNLWLMLLGCVFFSAGYLLALAMIAPQHNRRFFCSTEWARKNGLTPENLRLFSLCRNPQPSEARFSRTAIVGAVLGTSFTLTAVLVFMLANGLPFTGWFMLLPGACCMTLCGWVAVSQIRRSAGKIYGLWLAVFDGLFYPLLVLAGVIGWLIYQALWALHFRPGVNMENSAMGLVWFLTIVVCAIVDALIIHRVWRAVNQTTPAPSAPKPSRFWRWLAIALLAMLGLFAAALVLPVLWSYSRYKPAHGQAKHASSASAATDLSFDSFVERVRKELARASIRFDKLHISAMDNHMFAVSFSGLAAHGVVNGKDDWVSIVGALVAVRERGNQWNFRGKDGLATTSFVIPGLDLEKLLETNLAEVMPATTQNLSFGPVVEREISNNTETDVCMIDLDRNKLFPEPQTGMKTAELDAWTTRQGIDALAMTRHPGEIQGLVGWNMRTVQVGPDNWENITPTQLAEQLQAVQRLPETVMRGENTLPTTFLFKTREGGMGILQITGFTEDPRAVKIRYKLVQQTPNTQAQAQSVFDFNPVLALTVPMDATGSTDLFDPETGKIIPTPNPHGATPGPGRSLQKGLLIKYDAQANRTELVGMNGVMAQESNADQWYEITNLQALETLRRNYMSEGGSVGAVVSGKGLHTFLFKTGSGRIGLLQITGFTENPRGVKIRYKLVQQAKDISLTEHVSPHTPLQDEQFQFRWVASGGDANFPTDLMPDAQDGTGLRKLLVLRRAILESTDIASAEFNTIDPCFNSKEFSILLTEDGSRKMSAVTATNIGRQLAIVWKGRVVSAPVVSAPIKERSIIIGGFFNEEEREQLLDLFNHRKSAQFLASQKLIFGPVIERSLQDRRINITNCFIDFETGGVLVPPPEVSWRNEVAIWDWIKEVGVDAVATTEEGPAGLKDHELINTRLADNEWDSPPPLEKLTQRLRGSEWGRSEYGGGPTAQTLLTNDKSTNYARTYAFQTLDGTMGFLQFIENTNAPPGNVTFRYKLVENSPGKTAKRTTMPSASLSEPPRLNFLAWQEEWETNKSTSAWHPDGLLVTNDAELKLMKDVIPHGLNGGSSDDPQPRYLHVWFSHPGFDRSSFTEFSMIDVAGRPIWGGFPTRAMGGKEADELRGLVGWNCWTLNPGTRTNMPDQVAMRMRYTVGPFKRTQTILMPSQVQTRELEGGSKLTSLGQTSERQAFLTIAVDSVTSESRRFGVIAVIKDGRELKAPAQTDDQNTGLNHHGIRVERFVFDCSLADIRKFVIGSRPIRTNEWKNVVLRGN